MQAYAGTPAPFNFNGLVRHYYLRERPELGELQVNLAARGERKRASHAIALDLRERLKARRRCPAGTSIKVVEVPPGPPVLATLLAEIYGPDAATRRAVTGEIKKIFADVPFIVDIDDSIGAAAAAAAAVDRPGPAGILRRRAEATSTTPSRRCSAACRSAIRIAARTAIRSRSRSGCRSAISPGREALASTPVPANTLPGSKTVVELGEVVRRRREEGSPADLPPRRPLRRHGDGRTGRPLRGADLRHAGGRQPDRRASTGARCRSPRSACTASPADETSPTLLWDGEWEITYVTFRDMGAAFGVAILGIYILVVAQFGSFKLPLVILTPIPLTLIGIVHRPLAVRRAVHRDLDDRLHRARGHHRAQLDPAGRLHPPRRRRANSAARRLLEAGAVRFKPILLTALAAMIGAATILLDPIFQGLAISLLFGLASSTLLTVLVIPAIYIALRDDQRPIQQANG